MALSGVYPIVPTPFDADGNVDTARLERLATFVMESGASGPAVLGVMGEAQMMSEPERALVVKTMRQALPATTPLVAGVRAAGIIRDCDVCGAHLPRVPVPRKDWLSKVGRSADRD